MQSGRQVVRCVWQSSRRPLGLSRRNRDIYRSLHVSAACAVRAVTDKKESKASSGATKAKKPPTQATLTIRFDPKKTRRISDLPVPKRLMESFQRAEAGFAGQELTTNQREMLCVLFSSISVLMKGVNGSGRTAAALLYMLSLSRSLVNPHSITCLYVVPTKELGLQCLEFIHQVLGPDFPHKKENVVQLLYRGTSQENDEQIETLRRSKYPHILISTPTRLLDVLSQSEADSYWADLSELSFIGVDEADMQLLNPVPELYDEVMTRMAVSAKYNDSNRMANEKMPPIVHLLNYVVDWRNYKSFDERFQNRKDDSPVAFVPLKFLFLCSSYAARVQNLISFFNWCKGRPILSLGSSTVNQDLLSMSDFVDGVDLHCAVHANGHALQDFEPLIFSGEDIAKAQQFYTDLGKEVTVVAREAANYDASSQEFHAARVKERAQWSRETRLNITDSYIEGFLRILRSSPSKESWLVIIPTWMSTMRVMEMLSREKVPSCALDMTYDSERERVVLANTEGLSLAEAIEKGYVIIGKAITSVGIDFRGLERVCAFGYDSIEGKGVLKTMVGRVRPKDVKPSERKERGDGFAKLLHPPAGEEAAKSAEFTILCVEDDFDENSRRELTRLVTFERGLPFTARESSQTTISKLMDSVM